MAFILNVSTQERVITRVTPSKPLAPPCLLAACKGHPTLFLDEEGVTFKAEVNHQCGELLSPQTLQALIRGVCRILARGDVKKKKNMIPSRDKQFGLVATPRHLTRFAGCR